GRASLPARTGPVAVCRGPSSAPSGCVVVQVFLRDVVLGDLARADLALVGVGRVLDAADDPGLEGLPFLEQLLDALRPFDLGTRKAHGVAGLSGGPRAEPRPLLFLVTDEARIRSRCLLIIRH